jgi:hypothetical protein
MSLDVDEQRPTASHRHPARWWVIAGAAAVVVVAVVLAVVLAMKGGDRSATGSDPHAASGGALRALRVPAAGGRCLVPSADLLARHPVAFEGRVSRVGADSATLTVAHRFAGGPAGTVVVRRPPRTTEPGIAFVPGRTYLLAAGSDGTVAVCGLSGEKTPALARMYAAAFAG